MLDDKYPANYLGKRVGDQLNGSMEFELKPSGWKLMELINTITCKPSNASAYLPQTWQNALKQLMNCHRGQYGSLAEYYNGFKEIAAAAKANHVIFKNTGLNQYFAGK